MSVRRLSLVAVSCAVLTIGSTVSAHAQTRRPSDILALGSFAQVVNVIDGDTIEVSQNGNTFAVDYLGLKAPELDACYGVQAKQANAGFVQGKMVVIERDTTDTDASGTAPRYVYLVDGRMVNEELLKSGSAVASAAGSGAVGRLRHLLKMRMGAWCCRYRT
jgi:micrococcal nuclease